MKSVDSLVVASAEPGMSRHALLGAVDGLCGANRPAALVLGQAVKRLMARTDNWPAQARRLERLGLSARHGVAPLQELLDLPGDLAVISFGSGRFYLLHRSEQRWQIVGENGETVADVTDVASDQPLEALVLRMPFAHLTTDRGLGSLLALWPALRGAWAEIGLASLFINGGQLLLPLFSMIVYDKVVNNGVFETLWALVIGMAIYMLGDAGMRFVRAWSVERIGEALTRRGDETLWHRLVAQIDTPTGGFARFLSNYRDLSLSRDFVSSLYLLALADMPFLVLYLIVIGIIAWPLLIVAIILVAAYTVAGLALQNRANEASRDAEKEGTRKLAFMGEVLNALDVVRTVPGAGAFLRRWRDLSDRSAACDAKRRITANHLATMSAAMQTLATVVMLTAGAYLVSARMLTVGGLIASSLLLGRGMAAVSSLFTVVGKWREFRRAAARMESGLEAIADRDCVPRPEVVGRISVVGLSKGFEGRPAALSGVSLSFSPGERVALLGKPGAGKTTLLRCIAGLARPSSGQILVDGLALDDIARIDRVRWMAWKAQEPSLFAGSLDDNLRVGDRAVDNARLDRALWVSGLDVELSSGRMSLGMHIDERGANLSGGQRQKVALARALVQPSRLLLLDEPSLGLDPESERMLAERLPEAISADTVLLMTTHSGIMLRMAERVVALDGGRVVADGPREKLVQIESN